jgi:hypothetical protein
MKLIPFDTIPTKLKWNEIYYVNARPRTEKHTFCVGAYMKVFSN